MLVLALDTTTREGSCALARDGAVIDERAGDGSRPQAERLPGELMTLLDREHLALRDVDVFAVAVGPGSFTGLRVGIATMQGLAFAAGKPLVGVSALDALAASIAFEPFGRRGADLSGPRVAPDKAHPTGAVRVDARWIATWVDAWRGEVYTALYDERACVDEPAVEPPAQALGRIGERLGADRRGGGITFVGDGVRTHVDAVRAALPGAEIADPVAPLLAGTIARLATSVARSGDRPAPHAIRPLYVRRSDAELARHARSRR